MSNLIPADKLISEIEMRIAQWQTYTFACASQIASEAFDRIDELKGLLIYITSLQQEQPSLPSNLDEVAKKQAETIYPKIIREGHVAKHDVNLLTRRGFKKGFKAGAEWMAGQGESLSHLIAWYIQSVDAHEPIWTEGHLEELVKDYILIPKK